MYHSVNIMFVSSEDVKVIFAGCACCFVLLNVCVIGRGFFFFFFLKFQVSECLMQSSFTQSSRPVPLIFICSFGVGFELKLAL